MSLELANFCFVGHLEMMLGDFPRFKKRKQCINVVKKGVVDTQNGITTKEETRSGIFSYLHGHPNPMCHYR